MKLFHLKFKYNDIFQLCYYSEECTIFLQSNPFNNRRGGVYQALILGLYSS